VIDPRSETELKIPVTSFDEVRAALCESRAEKTHPMTREVNLLFDTKDGSFQLRGNALRLRIYGAQSLLTFKGPTSYQGKVKVREEIEVAVATAGPMAEILEKLGFSTAARYEKDREVWQMGQLSIVLDHTPMGNFVELEGPIDELENAARKTGLDPEEAVQGSYMSLWQEYRSRHPEKNLPSNMVFSG
jgi:adenylate cyclase class 2